MFQVSTSEFYTAAFVKARGARLLRITKTGPRFTFTFESKHPDLLEEYAAGGSVSALAMTAAISYLKRAMASGIQG